MSPSPGLARLKAGKPSRSPVGTAMHAASSRAHIARRPAWGGPALGPRTRTRTQSESPQQ